MKPLYVALIIFALIAIGATAEQRFEARLIDRGVKLESDRRDAANAKAKAAADELERKKERKFAQDQDAQSLVRYNEKVQNEKTIADLRARVRAGDIRMHVATSQTAVRGTEARGVPPAAGGPVQTQDAYLMPATVERILDIGRGIANDVQDYNSLLQEYDRLDKACRP